VCNTILQESNSFRCEGYFLYLQTLLSCHLRNNFVRLLLKVSTTCGLLSKAHHLKKQTTTELLERITTSSREIQKRPMANLKRWRRWNEKWVAFTTQTTNIKKQSDIWGKRRMVRAYDRQFDALVFKYCNPIPLEQNVGNRQRKLCLIGIFFVKKAWKVLCSYTLGAKSATVFESRFHVTRPRIWNPQLTFSV